MNVKEVLGDLGFKGLKDYNRDFRYGQKLHLTIDKKTGNWYNYKTNSWRPSRLLSKRSFKCKLERSKKVAKRTSQLYPTQLLQKLKFTIL
jgi:hypothetical protein